jgi:hypothetical protein
MPAVPGGGAVPGARSIVAHRDMAMVAYFLLPAGESFDPRCCRFESGFIPTLHASFPSSTEPA